MLCTGKAQSVVPPCKVWHLSHLCCVRKSQYLSFWQPQTLDWSKTCSLSPLNTHQCHINHTVHNLFNVCSNWTMIKLPWTRKKKKSSFCFWHTFDLEQGQGQQTWYEFDDPKQGNNHAKFERSHYNGIWEKANVEVFFSSKDMCELSPMNTCKGKKQNKNKSGIFMIWSVHITNNHTMLQLNRTRT